MFLNFTGILFFLISLIVAGIFKRKFAQYSQINLKSNLSGREVAAKMLADNGIYDVKVICKEGSLIDHYNPLDRTVNLSEGVYNGRSVASAAVAAHECGHAVQHAHEYVFLQFRSTLVPVTSAVSRFMPWIIFIGFILIRTSTLPLEIGIVLFGITTLFTFVTLPVEFDASRRALAWIDNNRIVDKQEHDMAKNALSWAAMTYVVAALGSLAELLRLILIVYNNRDRR